MLTRCGSIWTEESDFTPLSDFKSRQCP
jgi:hypothetical protein